MEEVEQIKVAEYKVPFPRRWKRLQMKSFIEAYYHVELFIEHFLRL
jgi:hypothetical protein